jgi:hypothetical protein
MYAQTPMRRDVRWVIATVIGMIGVVVAVVAWQFPKAVSDSAPVKLSPPRLLRLDHLRAGDCISGSSLNTDRSGRMTVVPCSRAHRWEVFFAGTNWPDDISYPGYSKMESDAYVRCNKVFVKYDGISSRRSKYTWTSIWPSAQTWSSGGRTLDCAAWHETSSHPGGALIYGSIRKSYK